MSKALAMPASPEFESPEPTESQVRSCASVLLGFLQQDEKQTGEAGGGGACL